MPIPDTLRHEIETFRETGRVVIVDPQGFAEPSFVSMLMGLGVVPKAYDPFVDMADPQQLHTHFVRVREAIAGTVGAMPEHADYIAQRVAAEPAWLRDGVSVRARPEDR